MEVYELPPSRVVKIDYTSWFSGKEKGISTAELDAGKFGRSSSSRSVRKMPQYHLSRPIKLTCNTLKTFSVTRGKSFQMLWDCTVMTYGSSFVFNVKFVGGEGVGWMSRVFLDTF